MILSDKNNRRDKREEEREMTTMKAAALRGADDIAVEQLPISETGPTDALIKVSLGGICGSDIAGKGQRLHRLRVLKTNP